MPKDLQRLHDRSSKVIEKMERISREAAKVAEQIRKILCKQDGNRPQRQG